MTGIDAAMLGTMVSETIELRTSQACKKWAAFNVGVGEGDNRQYVRIAVFGRLAERLAGELKNGDKVYIEAHSMRVSEWTSRTTGEVRTGLQAVGTKVEKAGTSAIGRNKPPKPKPEAQQQNGNGEQRDWQRPADTEI
jgi:single-stranded DNA-binding protein